MKYFGPPHLRMEDEIHIPTPVGLICMLCKEEIAANDAGTVNGLDQVFHYECRMRSAVGSIGHQLKLCSCFGGNIEDPSELTKRQAAKVACAYFHFNQGH